MMCAPPHLPRCARHLPLKEKALPPRFWPPQLMQQRQFNYTKGTPHTVLCGASLSLRICNMQKRNREHTRKSDDLLAFVQAGLAEDGPFGNVHRVVAQTLQILGDHEQIQHIVRVLGVLG